MPSLAADLADIVAGPSAPGVSIAYGTVVAADSRTVDVRIGGSVVAGICMTTSVGARRPGQRAILIGSPPLWTAIGSSLDYRAAQARRREAAWPTTATGPPSTR